MGRRVDLRNVVRGSGGKFMSFAAVGVASTAVNYVVFTVLLLAGIHHLSSAAAGYLSGVLFGFVFNKRITFRSDAGFSVTAAKYVLLYLVTLVVGLSFLDVLVQGYGLSPLLANVGSIGLTTVINFVGCSVFVFNKGFSVPLVFRHPLFLIMLAIKVVLAFLLGGEIIREQTIPFVAYFVESGFANPYQFFFDQGLSLFPYPPVMLWCIAFFRVFFSFLLQVTPDYSLFVNLFLVRVPLLIADMVILYVLSVFLKTRERLVLLLYWCSPILIYITYVHGQLDVIPMAFLFLSLLFLYRDWLWLSFVVLGLGVASKHHLVVVLPLYVLYLWKNRKTIIETVGLVLSSVAAFFVASLPFLFSPGLYALVFFAREQSRIYDLAVTFSSTGVTLYVVPAIMIGLLVYFASFRKISRDLLMMFLALFFSTLVMFVAPEPGWYYWSVPFLVFFVVKEVKRIFFVAYALLNVAYLAYFLFGPRSDILFALQGVFSSLMGARLPYELALEWGFDAALVTDALFTLLTTLLLALVVAVFGSGIRANRQFKGVQEPFTIGVAGDSGAGKSTLSSMFVALMGMQNVTIVRGDDMHKWERGDVNWSKFTHLNPKANRLHSDFKHALALKQGKVVHRAMYDHHSGKFTIPRAVRPQNFVVFEGLHQLFMPKMRQVCDLRVFMDIDPDLRMHWKVVRDVKERGYTREQVLQKLVERDGDSSRFIAPQAKYANVLIRYAPEKKIGIVGNVKESVDFFVEMQVSLNVNLDRLGEEIVRGGKAWFDHNFDLVSERQVCRFGGCISSERVREIAYSMVSNLESMLNYASPRWLADKEGMMQLVLLLCIQEEMGRGA